MNPLNRDARQTLENTQAQMRKGILEFCTLLIIRQHGPIYAPDILEELKKIDLVVVEGTIYPLLSRLRRDGLLEYAWRESKNGPPRKYYSLTGKGGAVANDLIDHWTSLSTSIASLLKSHA